MPRCLPALATALALAAACGGVQAASVGVFVGDPAGKPLLDAVVMLEPATGRLPVKPLAGVQVAQVNRQFAPQVSVVTVGTPVAFPNHDTVRHHVYSFSPAKTFELKLYAGVPNAPVVFDKPGVAVLGCNIHDQMVAWVVVVDTPLYARSAATGRAQIADVPPGNYRLRVWHSGLPEGGRRRPCRSRSAPPTSSSASCPPRPGPPGDLAARAWRRSLGARIIDAVPRPAAGGAADELDALRASLVDHARRAAGAAWAKASACCRTCSIAGRRPSPTARGCSPPTTAFARRYLGRRRDHRLGACQPWRAHRRDGGGAAGDRFPPARDHGPRPADLAPLVARLAAQAAATGPANAIALLGGRPYQAVLCR